MGRPCGKISWIIHRPHSLLFLLESLSTLRNFKIDCSVDYASYFGQWEHHKMNSTLCQKERWKPGQMAFKDAICCTEEILKLRTLMTVCFELFSRANEIGKNVRLKLCLLVRMLFLHRALSYSSCLLLGIVQDFFTAHPLENIHGAVLEISWTHPGQ